MRNIYLASGEHKWIHQIWSLFQICTDCVYHSTSDNIFKMNIWDSGASIVTGINKIIQLSHPSDKDATCEEDYTTHKVIDRSNLILHL